VDPAASLNQPEVVLRLGVPGRTGMLVAAGAGQVGWIPAVAVRLGNLAMMLRDLGEPGAARR
jgi:hypothetical protein